MKPFVRRAISVSLAIIYFCSQVVLGTAAETNIWQDRKKTNREPIRVASVSSLPLNTAPVISPSALRPVSARSSNGKTTGRLQSLLQSIPAADVSVQSVFDFNSPSRAPVVLVQDVHLNAEAQTNISRLLQTLIDKKQIGMVGVEGAFGDFDFEPFRRYPDAAITRRLTRDYFDKKRLSAPSYVGVTSETNPPPFIGVDDKPQYDANVQAYLSSRKTKSTLLKRLEEWESVQIAAKSKLFSPALKEFDDLRTAYHQEKIGLGEYVRRLREQNFVFEDFLVLGQFAEAYRLEISLDMKRVERERQKALEKLTSAISRSGLARLMEDSVAYRSGQLSFGAYYRNLKSTFEKTDVDLSGFPNFANYLRYVLLSDGIDSEKLVDELAELERRLGDRLAVSPEEKTLLSGNERLVLTKKLIDFGLTPTEWEAYRNSVATRLSFESAELKPFEEFYLEADRRSYSMTRNLFAAHKPGANSAAVLVVGGFHTPKILELLRRQNTPYVVVSPKVTKIDDSSGSAYLSVFAREKTALDKLFSGEKLFLSPPTHLQKGQSVYADYSRELARVQAPSRSLGGLVEWLKDIVYRKLTRVFSGLQNHHYDHWVGPLLEHVLSLSVGGLYAWYISPANAGLDSFFVSGVQVAWIFYFVIHLFDFLDDFNPKSSVLTNLAFASLIGGTNLGLAYLPLSLEALLAIQIFGGYFVHVAVNRFSHKILDSIGRILLAWKEKSVPQREIVVFDTLPSSKQKQINAFVRAFHDFLLNRLSSDNGRFELDLLEASEKLDPIYHLNIGPVIRGLQRTQFSVEDIQELADLLGEFAAGLSPYGIAFMGDFYGSSLAWKIFRIVENPSYSFSSLRIAHLDLIENYSDVDDGADAEYGIGTNDLLLYRHVFRQRAIHEVLPILGGAITQVWGLKSASAQVEQACKNLILNDLRHELNAEEFQLASELGALLGHRELIRDKEGDSYTEATASIQEQLDSKKIAYNAVINKIARLMSYATEIRLMAVRRMTREDHLKTRFNALAVSPLPGFQFVGTIHEILDFEDEDESRPAVELFQLLSDRWRNQEKILPDSFFAQTVLDISKWDRERFTAILAQTYRAHYDESLAISKKEFEMASPERPRETSVQTRANNKFRNFVLFLVLAPLGETYVFQNLIFLTMYRSFGGGFWIGGVSVIVTAFVFTTVHAVFKLRQLRADGRQFRFSSSGELTRDERQLRAWLNLSFVFLLPYLLIPNLGFAFAATAVLHFIYNALVLAGELPEYWPLASVIPGDQRQTQIKAVPQKRPSGAAMLWMRDLLFPGKEASEYARTYAWWLENLFVFGVGALVTAGLGVVDGDWAGAIQNGNGIAWIVFVLGHVDHFVNAEGERAPLGNFIKPFIIAVVGTALGFVPLPPVFLPFLIIPVSTAAHYIANRSFADPGSAAPPTSNTSDVYTPVTVEAPMAPAPDDLSKTRETVASYISQIQTLFKTIFRVSISPDQVLNAVALYFGFGEDVENRRAAALEILSKIVAQDTNGFDIPQDRFLGEIIPHLKRSMDEGSTNLKYMPLAMALLNRGQGHDIFSLRGLLQFRSYAQRHQLGNYLSSAANDAAEPPMGLPGEAAFQTGFIRWLDFGSIPAANGSVHLNLINDLASFALNKGCEVVSLGDEYPKILYRGGVFVASPFASQEFRDKRQVAVNGVTYADLAYLPNNIFEEGFDRGSFDYISLALNSVPFSKPNDAVTPTTVGSQYQWIGPLGEPVPAPTLLLTEVQKTGIHNAIRSLKVEGVLFFDLRGRQRTKDQGVFNIICRVGTNTYRIYDRGVRYGPASIFYKDYHARFYDPRHSKIKAAFGDPYSGAPMWEWIFSFPTLLAAYLDTSWLAIGLISLISATIFAVAHKDRSESEKLILLGVGFGLNTVSVLPFVFEAVSWGGVILGVSINVVVHSLYNCVASLKSGVFWHFPIASLIDPDGLLPEIKTYDENSDSTRVAVLEFVRAFERYVLFLPGDPDLEARENLLSLAEKVGPALKKDVAEFLVSIESPNLWENRKSILARRSLRNRLLEMGVFYSADIRQVKGQTYFEAEFSRIVSVKEYRKEKRKVRVIRTRWLGRARLQKKALSFGTEDGLVVIALDRLRRYIINTVLPLASPEKMGYHVLGAQVKTDTNRKIVDQALEVLINRDLFETFQTSAPLGRLIEALANRVRKLRWLNSHLKKWNRPVLINQMNLFLRRNKLAYLRDMISLIVRGDSSFEPMAEDVYDGLRQINAGIMENLDQYDEIVDRLMARVAQSLEVREVVREFEGKNPKAEIVAHLNQLAVSQVRGIDLFMLITYLLLDDDDSPSKEAANQIFWWLGDYTGFPNDLIASIGELLPLSDEDFQSDVTDIFVDNFRDLVITQADIDAASNLSTKGRSPRSDGREEFGSVSLSLVATVALCMFPALLWAATPWLAIVATSMAGLFAVVSDNQDERNRALAVLKSFQAEKYFGEFKGFVGHVSRIENRSLASWISAGDQAEGLIRDLRNKQNDRLVLGLDQINKDVIDQLRSRSELEVERLVREGRLEFVVGDDTTNVLDFVEKATANKGVVSFLVLEGAQFPDRFFELTESEWDNFQQIATVYLVTRALQAVSINALLLPSLHAFKESLKHA